MKSFKQPPSLLGICIVLSLTVPRDTKRAACQNVRDTYVCNIALFITRERNLLTVGLVREANEKTVSR
jgi:hypothetical protein